MSRDEDLNRLASRQEHLFSVRQAVTLGFTPQSISARVRKHGWQRAGRGVVCTSAGNLTWRQKAMAAVLTYGPDTFLSHRAAARLWGLDGVDGSWVEVTRPRPSRPRPGVTVHVGE
ncbi:MAG TPA: type IV toxin-antitoxin system AbiEi family antitoxin domain-containing protein, partial [Actinomycetota bacterium]|nr:type IV toxin-antitoxin system AbiEi family antitoxin domain-containing protein [Actinomycetota bacterium]